MTARPRRTAWLGLYAILVAALPILALVADPRAGARSWSSTFSAVLAFVGFVILLLQFALVSRLKSVSTMIGSDALARLHRNMALLALVFLVAHPLLTAAGRGWRVWSLLGVSAGLRAGAIAFWLMVLVILTSLARRRFRLSYESWQILHLTGVCALIGASLAHTFLIGTASRAPAIQWALAAYVTLFLTLLLRYRLVRPFFLAGRPWTIASNADCGGSTRIVRVRPEGHAGFAFLPGQFAWFITGRHPIWSAQHPLSIASSDRRAADGSIEFAVKARGDWSTTVVPALAPGRRVFVDGPFGAFTPDLSAGAPLILVAGGIGIAPLRSMLLALRDRRDKRPVVLFYAAAGLARVIFRDELAGLEDEISLRVVYVLERPETGWSGEHGLLTADIVRRHAAALLGRAECFVCGPVPMMEAVEAILRGLGVPASRIHTERFQVV